MLDNQCILREWPITNLCAVEEIAPAFGVDDHFPSKWSAKPTFEIVRLE